MPKMWIICYQVSVFVFAAESIRLEATGNNWHLKGVAGKKVCVLSQLGKSSGLQGSIYRL